MKIARPYNGRRGFTLVEILIAMAIFMVIIGAIYASWTSILRASQAGSRAAADVQRTRMTVKCIEDAVASTVFFTENSAFYSFEADTTADFAYLSLVSRLPSSFPGSGLFGSEPLRRVAFEVVPGPGGNELKMMQSSTLQVLQDTETPYTLTLATNISQFTLEFWDDTAEEWAYEWLETNSVPRMVRVSLAFGGQNGSTYASSASVQTKTIYLAGTAITKDFQMPDPAGGSRPPRNNTQNPVQIDPTTGTRIIDPRRNTRDSNNPNGNRDGNNPNGNFNRNNGNFPPNPGQGGRNSNGGNRGGGNQGMGVGGGKGR